MRNILCSLVFLLSFVASAKAGPLMTDAVRESEPLLPYFTWLSDPEGTQTIYSVSSSSRQESFTPLPGGVPLRAKGPVWLRLVLAKGTGVAGSRRADGGLVMNLGELPPGQTELYLPEEGASGTFPLPGKGGIIAYSRETVASHENVALPTPGLIPSTLYLRLEESPGLWFNPVVTPKDNLSPPLLPPALLLPGLLLIALAASLLRAARDRAGWPLWVVLFLGCVLTQTLLPLPRLDAPFTLDALPALLAPGMALLLLPHIGRCMLRSAGKLSFVQDGMLYLCSLLGGAVCLAPLMPGMSWLARLFPLWPLLLIPLLPLCLGMLAGKKPGSLAFSGACFMPVAGAGIALYALYNPALHPLASQGGLWGLAVGGIGLALARIPEALQEHEQTEALPAAGLSLADSAVDAARAEAAAGSLDITETASFSNKSQYEELPPLPVLKLDGAESKNGASAASSDGLTAFGQESDSLFASFGESRPSGEASAAGISGSLAEPLPSLSPANGSARPQGLNLHAAHSSSPASSLETPLRMHSPSSAKGKAREEEIAEFLDGLAMDGKAAFPEKGADPGLIALEDEGAGLREAYAADAPDPADGDAAVLSAAPLIPPCIDEGASIFGPDSLSASGGPELPESLAPKPISLEDDGFAAYASDILEQLQEGMPHSLSVASHASFVFSLNSLVREVHDAVSPLAKSKGLIFSWFTAPSIPSLLEGDAPRLRQALTLLLQNSVQSTAKGSVELSIRKDPSPEPHGGTTAPDCCDLLITIRDSGSAQRTDAGFFHAWELAARTGGTFTVEYTPTGGTLISFTIRLALPSDEAAAEHLAQQAASGPQYPREEEPDLSSLFSAPKRPSREESGTNRETASPSRDTGMPAKGAAPFESSDSFFADPAGAFMPAADAGNRSGKREGGSPRVLVAHMTTSNRRLVAHYLGNLDCGYAEAATDTGILEDFRSGPVALAVFDADMPESDLLRTMAALREEEADLGRPRTPVLILTSHDAQAQRMLDAGCTHTLNKPFTQSELETAIMRAVPSLSRRPGAPEPDDGDENWEHPFEKAAVSFVNRMRLTTGARADKTASAAPVGAQETAREGDSAHAAAAAYGNGADALSSEAAPAEPHDARDAAPPTEPAQQEESRTRDSGAPGEPSAPHKTREDEPAAIPPADQRPEAPEDTFEMSGSGFRTPAPLEAAAAPAAQPGGAQEHSGAQERTSVVRVQVSPFRPEARTDAAPGAKAAEAPHAAPAAAKKTTKTAMLIIKADPEAKRDAPEHAAGPGAGEKKNPVPAAPVVLGLSPDDVTPSRPAGNERPLLHMIVAEDAATQTSARAGESSPSGPDASCAAMAQAIREEAAKADMSEDLPIPAHMDAEAAPQAEVREPQPTTPLASEQAFLLPGMDGEAVEQSMMPLIPGLIHALRDAVEDAEAGRDAGETLLIQESTGRLASKAEIFGLRRLGKIARCVERAATADDLEAAATLLEDLSSVTARYLSALQECYHAFLNIER